MRRIWIVLSFAFVSFLCADQAFPQTCQSEIWCAPPSYPAGKLPNCFCTTDPPPPCGQCEIQMGSFCVPVTCPPPGLTRGVRGNVNRPLPSRRPRSVNAACLRECRSFCSPAADCRGLVGSALGACLRQCRAECERECTWPRR